jgi:hypothetical protein
MNTSTILAIDLGKYNSVSCHYEPETEAVPTEGVSARGNVAVP